MSYTVSDIDTPTIPNPRNMPNQFDLPSKEFVGYDPKGTTSVTGSALPEKSDVKQSDKYEEEKQALEPAKEESVALSPKITALARKEQAQRQREQAFRQREKEFAEKLAKADKYDQLRAKLESKDYSAADDLGLSYEEYTQYLLKKQEGEDPAEARYRKVESELESIKKSQEEQVIKEYQANQALWKEAISKLVTEDEAYSTVKEMKAEDAVLKHINDSFDEDGVELTVEQAAKEIEDALLERGEKFASLSKIKKKFGEAPKTLGPPKTAPKTITNTMAPTSEKPVTKPFHLMSESEQIAEAYRRVQAAKINRG